MKKVFAPFLISYIVSDLLHLNVTNMHVCLTLDRDDLIKYKMQFLNNDFFYLLMGKNCDK